jgi:hypothetical protein
MCKSAPVFVANEEFHHNRMRKDEEKLFDEELVGLQGRVLPVPPPLRPTPTPHGRTDERAHSPPRGPG